MEQICHYINRHMVPHLCHIIPRDPETRLGKTDQSEGTKIGPLLRDALARLGIGVLDRPSSWDKVPLERKDRDMASCICKRQQT